MPAMLHGVGKRKGASMRFIDGFIASGYGVCTFAAILLVSGLLSLVIY